jgi:hypothetical protein
MEYDEGLSRLLVSIIALALPDLNKMPAGNR